MQQFVFSDPNIADICDACYMPHLLGLLDITVLITFGEEE
jgi:hypothetical protein